MSHTDKDRPYWVRVRDTGLVEHDHRDGRCVVADDRRERWTYHRHHNRVCAKLVYEPGIPCVCDDFERPTCFPAESPAERYSAFGGGGVPRWFVSYVWHAPERVRARNELRGAAKAFNAGESLEDFDFENRQGRSSARWNWH